MGCTNNNDLPEEPIQPSPTGATINSDLLEQQASEAADLMFDSSTNTPAELIEALKSLDYVQTSEVDEYGLVHVTTKDGGYFTLDIKGVCHTLENAIEVDVEAIDNETIAEAEEIHEEIARLTAGSETMEINGDNNFETPENDWEGFANLENTDEEEDFTYEFPDDWDETPANIQRHTSPCKRGASRSGGDRVVLNRWRMAFWNPWNFSNDQELVKNAIDAANNYAEGHTISSKTLSSTPAGLKAFGNYDLVFMFGHGAPDGSLSIPGYLWDSYIDSYVTPIEPDGTKNLDSDAAKKDGIVLNFSKITAKDGEEEKLESVLLSQKYIQKNLSDLSRTIVWGAVCYGGTSNSQLRKALKAKNCAAFVGADNECTLTGILSEFKPYILRLFTGGNSSLCFANGASSRFHSDKVKDGGTANYNLSHFSDKVVSYFRAYTLGQTRGVIRTADLKLRYIYGRGTTSGPEIGLVYTSDGKQAYKVPLKNMAKVKTSSRTWQNCAMVYDVTVRLRNLTPETKYSYAGYVFDGSSLSYSHAADAFKTDGFTGYYRVKFLRKNWGYSAYLGDEVSQYESLYRSFTTKPFDFTDNMLGACALSISGNTITWQQWSHAPYYGECGGDHCSTVHGTFLNEDWDYFRTSSGGWSTHEANEYCPAGVHHHDMSESHDYAWYQKRPTIYTERNKVAPSRHSSTPQLPSTTRKNPYTGVTTPSCPGKE